MDASSSSFKVLGRYYNTIDGRLSETPRNTYSINPATGKANPPVPLSRSIDVDHAVTAAKRAFKPWAKVPYRQRREAVLAFANAIERHQDDFAKLLTQEQGKAVCVVHHFIPSPPD
jgi:acyl-CoA reductase-like NAD-dependent aldehyde dehydrogenase